MSRGREGWSEKKRREGWALSVDGGGGERRRGPDDDHDDDEAKAEGRKDGCAWLGALTREEGVFAGEGFRKKKTLRPRSGWGRKEGEEEKKVETLPSSLTRKEGRKEGRISYSRVRGNKKSAPTTHDYFSSLFFPSQVVPSLSDAFPGRRKARKSSFFGNQFGKVFFFFFPFQCFLFRLF